MMSSMNKEQALNSIAYLCGKYPDPHRDSVEEYLRGGGYTEVHGMNPRFDLAMHFPDGSSGITGNSWKGPHQTVPCYSDDHQVVFLETSTYKGRLQYEIVYWDQGWGHSIAEILDQTPQKH